MRKRALLSGFLLLNALALSVLGNDVAEDVAGSGGVTALQGAANIDCSRQPPFVNMQKCCTTPTFATEALRQKCLQRRATPSHRRGQGRNQHFRALQYKRNNYWSCVLNETGILRNDTLNEAHLQSHLALIFGNDTRMLPTVAQAFHTCYEQREMLHEFAGTHANCSHTKAHHHLSHLVQTIAKVFRPQSSHDRHSGGHHSGGHHSGGHHSGGGHRRRNHHRRNRPHHTSAVNRTNARQLMGCVYRETFVHCQPELWSGEPLCDERRDFLAACGSDKHELRPMPATERPVIMPPLSPLAGATEGSSAETADQQSEEAIHRLLLNEELHPTLNEISDELDDLDIDLRMNGSSERLSGK